jgi:hypothetical protein
MLNEIDSDIITQHGKIALCLLAAEHVVPIFAARPNLRPVLEEMLRADWSWMESRAPTPSEIYWKYMPPIMQESSTPAKGLLSAAFQCCIDAQYYTIWCADGITYIEEPGKVEPVGSDIPEVDESHLTSCLEAAINASPQPEKTTEWLNGLIARMEREHRRTETNVIGPRIKRASFIVPVLAP